MESNTQCLICGAQLPEGKTCGDAYNELLEYTLSHPDQRYFIHQHIVDAYGAQHITENTKPVAAAASLMGLYLFVERNYSGKEVQKAHMQAGNKMKEWPKLQIPTEKARITVADVLAVFPGESRDRKIKEWVRAVWDLWRKEQKRIAQFSDANLGLVHNS